MFPVLFVRALVQAHDACKHDQGFVVACGERGGGRGAQAAASSAGARDVGGKALNPRWLDSAGR